MVTSFILKFRTALMALSVLLPLAALLTLLSSSLRTAILVLSGFALVGAIQIMVVALAIGKSSLTILTKFNPG